MLLNVSLLLVPGFSLSNALKKNLQRQYSCFTTSPWILLFFIVVLIQGSIYFIILNINAGKLLGHNFSLLSGTIFLVKIFLSWQDLLLFPGFSSSKLVSIFYICLLLIHILICVISWMRPIWWRGYRMLRLVFPASQSQGCMVFATHRQTSSCKYSSCLLFLFVFKYSLISSVFPNQIESWRPFCPACLPQYLFNSTFRDLALLGLPWTSWALSRIASASSWWLGEPLHEFWSL